MQTSCHTPPNHRTFEQAACSNSLKRFKFLGCHAALQVNSRSMMRDVAWMRGALFVDRTRFASIPKFWGLVPSVWCWFS